VTKRIVRPDGELRREQAYLAEAQRLTHTGGWASNLVTGQVFHSSEENNRLYGFDLRQYPNPFDLHYSSILAEDEPALRTKLENAIRAGADFDVEYRIRRADGAIRFPRGIGYHNPAQEFGEFFGITMDITDRKHAEKGRENPLRSDMIGILSQRRLSNFFFCRPMSGKPGEWFSVEAIRPSEREPKS
jgi:hypothetical protein